MYHLSNLIHAEEDEKTAKVGDLLEQFVREKLRARSFQPSHTPSSSVAVVKGIVHMRREASSLPQTLRRHADTFHFVRRSNVHDLFTGNSFF